MSNSKLIELSYYDPSAQVRLSAYADTLVLDHDQNGSIIRAIRFGGYPEMVRAMADAIYGGATIEAAQNDTTRMLQSSLKSYQRQITHDGIYAVATLMTADTVQKDAPKETCEKDEDTNLVDTEQMELQPRRCYIFCPTGDQRRLFEELDRKTAAPLIPEFQDYVLNSLRQRGDLRQLEVISLKERMDAWVLDLKPQDQNVVEVLEQGLQSGAIQIPGTLPGSPDGFENVENVTGYLNTFGVTVADRIRNQFMPLFDPAKEPLSDEVLAINDCIMSRVGYSLYDAQLAVAEAVKRQLARKRVALIIAECGSGKTKIGSTALGALHGLWADQKRKDGRKSFGIVMCPSHVTQKWVREIGETLPDTYGMVVRTISDINRLYAMYEKGDKSVFAVFSKEQARDGYMRYPAVRWNRRRRAFLCPDCDGVIEMEISEDGSRYTVPADQFFFQKEHKKNHTCPHCGTPLWSAVNPDKRIDWVKIGEYGWVYRYGAQAHLHRTKNERVLDQLTEIAQNPDAFYPIRGAHQRFPLSTYIKKKLRGRIDGFLCDELHEYNNNSGQGDAMAELYGASRCFVGMTATLINGYSSGIFHLLYRLQNIGGMTVGRVQNQGVYLGIDQRAGTIHNILGYTDSGGAQQATLFVAGGVGVLDALFNILNGHQTGKLAVLVYQRQLLHLGAHQNFLGLLQGGAGHRGDQLILGGHHSGDGHGEVRHKPHIPVGKNTHQCAVRLADGHTADLVFTHQILRVLGQVPGREEKRIGNDAVLRALYLIDLRGLILNGHILVNYADTALTGNGDGHIGLGDRVHGRGHQGDIQGNILGQLGGQIHFVGQHIGLCRDQQNIVKGQPFFYKLCAVFAHYITSVINKFLFREEYFYYNSTFCAALQVENPTQKVIFIW